LFSSCFSEFNFIEFCYNSDCLYSFADFGFNLLFFL
jgi:hypothetical protein